MENINRVKISSIVESQLPSFVVSDYPLVSELLTEYYKSLDSTGFCYDILQNIDQYVKVNNLTNIIEETTLSNDVGFGDDTIYVESTDGFPKTYGLIKINEEIILYKSKTDNTFDNCTRGFSGITEYFSEELTFSSSLIAEHQESSSVQNLSLIFLKEFFKKLKKQFSFGFEDRDIVSNVNENIFLGHSKDFYSSKGTPASFEILFRVLYGKDVEVITPSKYLIKPSSSNYRVTRNYVVEPILGNITDLENQTVFQDEYENIQKSFGTVSSVRSIVRNEKYFYILELDYDFDKDINVDGSIFGSLSIHPKTKIINFTKGESNTIIVDSTIGFPSSGELVVRESGIERIVAYSGKTVNQFLNCSLIYDDILVGYEISLNTYAYGFSKNNEEIRFRVSGVLSDITLPEETKLYGKDDLISVVSLGYNDENSVRENSWILNRSVKCNVESFSNNGGFKYIVETFDNNGIYSGDSVEIEYTNADTGKKEVSIIDGNKVKLPEGGIPQKKIQIETDGYLIKEIFSIKKIISKFSNFVSDVLNVYKDIDSNDTYLTSSSLPFYDDTVQSVNDFKFVLSGSFSGETLTIGKHGLLTGDSIVYSVEDNTKDFNKLNINPGIYYIKRESDTDIKIALSRENIFKQKFVSIASTSINEDLNRNTIILAKFSKDGIPSSLDSQKIVRLLSDPIDVDNFVETPLETPIAVLQNGVEVLNYKSKDKIYYGAIESVEVLSSGRDYDIINPPVLNIKSPGVGFSSCKAYCGVDEGYLKKIDVVDGGFDYIDNPVVVITGGGGEGATAVAKMIDYEHLVDFNSSSSNKRINLVDNIIGFSTYHRFRDGENVVYLTNKNQAIGGLSDESSYFVSVIDEFRIKLHTNLQDSLNRSDEININSFGLGNHLFKSRVRKRKINSILVTNPGYGYKTKKISVPSSGINTFNDTINVYENPFNDKELIYYYGGDSNIGGLSTGRYIATKVDNKSFKLSEVGTGNTDFDFYHKTKQYINFTSSGQGNHTFDYEPFSINIIGKTGISTYTPNVGYAASVNAHFKGKISSIFVHDGGTGYGSTEILNYNAQPEFSLDTGEGAEISPIILNGKIQSVVVKQSGKNYNSPPNLIISGSGSGAILTPIIENGKLIEVKVINTGANYSNDTYIQVLSWGQGCTLKFYPQTWTINNVFRLLDSDNIPENDSIVYGGNNEDYGLQYTHSYSPRSLRKKIFSQGIDNGIIKYKSDYQNDFDSEKYHSPILGWAYDGNPIYGSYGYDSLTNKSVRQIKSGYSIPTDNQTNRPKSFKPGFFVEDYIFSGDGDLDEHNGRYCITPEFPNGTYAYFATLEDNLTTLTNKRDKRPKFPYFIGNTYKSKIIDFNKILSSNQDSFDFGGKNIVRNTTFYNTTKSNSSYEYFLNYSDIKSHKIKITSADSGSVESIRIISSGKNYKVGDRINFNNEGSGGSGASGKVKYIEGKNIVSISQTSTLINDVEFYPNNYNSFVGFSSVPHNFNSNDIVFIDSTLPYNESLEGYSSIKFESSKMFLSLGVGSASSTGNPTYFYVSSIPENIRENDIFTINSEDIKILNVDRQSFRVRVLREQNSTVSSAHSAYSVLTENPRKFFIEKNKNIQQDTYRLNKEIYFNPSDSVGIGTSVGIGYTITFSNPGIGASRITIPTKSIYLKNHGLKTGDKIVYNTNDGVGITVSYNGNNAFSLQNGDVLYAARISDDLIGISTVKVNMTSSGEFVGISSASTLFFNSSGVGSYHSFKSTFDDVQKTKVYQNSVTVSLGETHSLKVNDVVFINSSIGISTTVKLKYNEYNARLIANPRTFSSIDIVDNSINIENHGYHTGEKLIYTSNNPSGGLSNNGIYYAIVVSKNKIKLTSSYYKSIYGNSNDVIDITTSTSGTLSQVNPKISVLNDRNIIFDLSDESLSEIVPGTTSKRIPSFDFSLFTDSKLKNKFNQINSDGTSAVKLYGKIGVDSTARAEFKFSGSSFRENLWYGLIPKSNLDIKNNIVYDSEVIDYGKIVSVKNSLNGRKIISGITSSTFTFVDRFENELGDTLSQTTDGIFEYYTDSLNDFGKIRDITVTSGGNSYNKFPSISSITSANGVDAIIVAQSENIGKIESYEVLDFGYDYPSDPSMKPYLKLPTVLRLEPLSSIDSIEVISTGKNYLISPKILLIDGFTNKVVEDAYLDFDIEEKTIKIIKNSRGIYNITPRIVATNNTNGVGISSITYNSLTKEVSVYLNKQFSDIESFPFTLGENVFIEGISISDDNRGYNSENYDYNTFTLTGIQTSLGGANSYVKYSLSEYLNESEEPGTFDPTSSSGVIVPEKYQPTFKVRLKKNIFLPGEEVIDQNGSRGKVLRFDVDNDYLIIESIDKFSENVFITSSSSKSKAFVEEILSQQYSFAKVDSSTIVNSGWYDETGFLNSSLSRIHDNDYYQYFSYSLKSEVSIDKWNEPVSNLNHTVGFKKFSDLLINSKHENSLQTTEQNEGSFVGICDLNSIVDIECFYDFDLVSENSFYVNNSLTSDEMIFNSTILIDYSESIGNRVLLIDDISGDFTNLISKTYVTSFSI